MNVREITDTEMLDYLIENKAVISTNGSQYWLLSYHSTINEACDGMFNSPREAIIASIKREIEYL
jgi:hypothetical protein